jgi:predicted DNA-binding transcriptional regulator AlpA
MQAQDRFDEQYIAAPEIMKFLGVTRATLLHARRIGKLPKPIHIANGPFVWERDAVKDILKQWKEELNTRRGVTNG